MGMSTYFERNTAGTCTEGLTLRTVILGISCAILAGCTSLGTLFMPPTSPSHTTALPDAPIAGSNATGQSRLPTPRPAPELVITGDPDPENLAKKSEIVQVQAKYQEAPSSKPPAAQVREANSSPQPPAEVPTSLRDVYRLAKARDASLESYAMRLRRREFINGKPQPEEVMLCYFRKEPWSVYFKWIGPEGKGREVIYVKNQHGNQIHTLTAAGDVPFMSAGSRFKVAPDSFLVRSKSRYPITDAGLSNLIERFGKLSQALEKGDERLGTAQFLGLVKRPEFDKEVVGIRQVLPARVDPTLPKGGERVWYFDPSLHVPTLVIATDDAGREVEYYCHDRIQQFPLSDDDFNPERRWPAVK